MKDCWLVASASCRGSSRTTEQDHQLVLQDFSITLLLNYEKLGTTVTATALKNWSTLRINIVFIPMQLYQSSLHIRLQLNIHLLEEKTVSTNMIQRSSPTNQTVFYASVKSCMMMSVAVRYHSYRTFYNILRILSGLSWLEHEDYTCIIQNLHYNLARKKDVAIY